MRVLVAGASGAIGRPLVRRLAGGGHEVHAMTRSPDKRASLEAMGAVPVVADALDADAVRRAVEAARPEAIVHQLTALPPMGPTRMGQLKQTARLRTEGTDNLVQAGLATGVRRIVAQSIVFIYGYRDHGDAPLEETHPAEVGGRFDEGLVSVRYLEDRVLGTDGLEGIALRYGLFYAPDGDGVRGMARLLRRRLLAMPGGGRGVGSFIHLDDAAAATVAALERGRPGEAYNVVDDEPAEWAQFLAELARRVGAPPPRSVPLWLARPLVPYASYFMARVRLPVSNAKARAQLGWAPAHPTYREGLAGLSG
jgi:nucleoside-diphosphate-sugar epimerase